MHRGIDGGRESAYVWGLASKVSSRTVVGGQEICRKARDKVSEGKGFSIKETRDSVKRNTVKRSENAHSDEESYTETDTG